MTDQPVFRASYSNWRLVRTRGVIEVVFELPVEQAHEAYRVLGGMPQPGQSIWCGIARLNDIATREDVEAQKAENKDFFAGAKKSWHEISPSQQAGLLCNEPAFCQFLIETYPVTWHSAEGDKFERAAATARHICRVKSRSEIKRGTVSEKHWNRLVTDYRAFMRAPEVVNE